MHDESPREKPVTLIIAEDQLMTAEGLAAILEKDNLFKVLAISPNGEHLLHLLNSVQPVMILLDLNMPVMDGVTACKAIRGKFPKIVVVALTMYNHAKTQKEVKEAGAAGMFKYTSSGELIKKLAEILIDTGKQRFVINDNHAYEESNAGINGEDNFLLQYKITKRELEIIRLIAEGVPTDAIAEKLFLSAHTVTTHRKNILGKLKLNNSAELINLMHKNGLLK